VRFRQGTDVLRSQAVSHVRYQRGQDTRSKIRPSAECERLRGKKRPPEGDGVSTAGSRLRRCPAGSKRSEGVHEMKRGPDTEGKRKNPSRGHMKLGDPISKNITTAVWGQRSHAAANTPQLVGVSLGPDGVAARGLTRSNSYAGSLASSSRCRFCE